MATAAKWYVGREAIVEQELHARFYRLVVIGVGPKYVRLARGDSTVELFRFNHKADPPRNVSENCMPHNLYTLEEYEAKQAAKAAHKALTDALATLNMANRSNWTSAVAARLKAAAAVVREILEENDAQSKTADPDSKVVVAPPT